MENQQTLREFANDSKNSGMKDGGLKRVIDRIVEEIEILQAIEIRRKDTKSPTYD